MLLFVPSTITNIYAPIYIFNMKITSILLNWKRAHNIESNLKTILSEPECGEVILWDNSGIFKTDYPITVINSQKNLGANIRYSLASMASYDNIFMMDDDIKIKPGLFSDLLKYSDDNTALGICGKIFNKGDYSYKEGEIIKSEELDEYPKAVNHIVAYCMLMKKWMFLNHDYSKFSWTCGEIDLFGRLPRVNKLIIPTDKFENLHDMTDENALSLKPGADEEYERTFKKYYANPNI